MMTSSNGNTFRVTGPLCEEFTGEFLTQRSSNAELWCFLLSASKQTVEQKNRDAGYLRHGAHYGVTVMSGPQIPQCPWTPSLLTDAYLISFLSLLSIVQCFILFLVLKLQEMYFFKISLNFDQNSVWTRFFSKYSVIIFGHHFQRIQREHWEMYLDVILRNSTFIAYGVFALF